jgi:lipoprotein-anchoring transpeptidase ErfK/SrfK
MRELQGGFDVPGAARDPLGSCAMSLRHGNKDTLYRIHGTVEPGPSARVFLLAASV